jgi:hypothetical protein
LDREANRRFDGPVPPVIPTKSRPVRGGRNFVGNDKG